MKIDHTITAKTRRTIRVRSKVRGTADRPRLSVYRSNRTTYLQLIDDAAGKTVASATGKEVKGAESLTKLEEAIAMAKILVEKASKLKVTKAVFDRGAYKYHGRVKAIADAVRAAGMEM